MIIEIIGPAGAGKSTLAKALFQRIGDAKVETPPSLWKAGNVPFFIRNTCSIFPIVSRFYLQKNGRYPLWYHYISMVMLNGWHHVLNKRARKGRSVIILDQGPVYMIVFETLFGCGRVESLAAKKYWQRAFHCWAQTLDLVICLDTSLPLLVDRIRKRETGHGVRSLSDRDAYQYLEAYRQGYESVISRLAACSVELKLVHIDTGRVSLGTIVEKVINEVQLEESRNRRCAG